MKVKATEGDRVRVHYTGKLEDGSVFDSSRERGEPLDFVIGEGTLLKGFESAIIGLSVQESRELRLKPEEAYGEYDPELTMQIPRDSFPEGVEPEPGMTLGLTEGEQSIMVTVVEVQPEAVTVDGNHPLAGKTLLFECELVELFKS